MSMFLAQNTWYRQLPPLAVPTTATGLRDTPMGPPIRKTRSATPLSTNSDAMLSLSSPAAQKNRNVPSCTRIHLQKPYRIDLHCFGPGDRLHPLPSLSCTPDACSGDSLDDIENQTAFVKQHGRPLPRRLALKLSPWTPGTWADRRLNCRSRVANLCFRCWCAGQVRMRRRNAPCFAAAGRPASWSGIRIRRTMCRCACLRPA